MNEYEDIWAQDDVADTAYVARSQVPTAIYQTVTTKVPPLYDGRSSWFAFEEAIDDWCDITELEPEKRGPALRNRLEGEAAIYKSLLDRERLRNAEDGVNYFKRELRPHFVKGNQSVFLWRFFQLFRASRGQQEFLRWIGRYQVLIKRLMDAWMDLHEIQTDEAILAIPEYQQGVFEAEQLAGARLTPEQIADSIRDYRAATQRRHRNSFPLTDNMVSLVMVVQADLTEMQRERFASSMSLRGMSVQQYTTMAVRDMFIELFCAPRSSLENPSLRTGTVQNQRSFCILEEGEMDGVTGYWAEDDDTGDVGFLPEFEDTFWLYDDTVDAWLSQPFRGRRVRRGPPRRKGKGRGKSGRKRFRPKGKGKGRKGKYSSNWGEDEIETETDEYADWTQKGKGKKGKKGKSYAEPPESGKSYSPDKGKGKHAHTAEWQESNPQGSLETPVPETSFLTSSNSCWSGSRGDQQPAFHGGYVQDMEHTDSSYYQGSPVAPMGTASRDMEGTSPRDSRSRLYESDGITCGRRGHDEGCSQLWNQV